MVEIIILLLQFSTWSLDTECSTPIENLNRTLVKYVRQIFNLLRKFLEFIGGQYLLEKSKQWKSWSDTQEKLLNQIPKYQRDKEHKL